jgi:predicted nucleic acid-binding protein
MPDTIISDASCFIILSNIDHLDLLQKTYGSVVTTAVIASEFGADLPDWVIIKNPRSVETLLDLQSKLDRGEASAVALAMETPNATIILDDQKARKVAEALGIKVTGTLGVLIQAKLKNVIPSIRPILDRIRRTNFRLSPDIEEEALRQAGE